MSLDPSSLESDLARLRPTALDESLLARLDACATDTWPHLQPAEIQFEQRLRAITPATLPFTQQTSLESALRDVPFPGIDHILPFPIQKPAALNHHRAWWSAAAAAVALIGAITALRVPINHHPDKLASTPPESRTTSPAPVAPELVPAGITRGLSEARDEGVIWQSNDQPHRVLKIIYMDRVTLKDAAGHTYQVDQPRVEYILVPAKTD
jgi:hypothetical protein